jgi:hypothetical protein
LFFKIKIVCTDSVLIKKSGGIRPCEALATNYKFRLEKFGVGIGKPVLNPIPMDIGKDK